VRKQPIIVSAVTYS